MLAVIASAVFAAAEAGVGTKLLREDEFAKIWELTLAPGEQTYGASAAQQLPRALPLTPSNRATPPRRPLHKHEHDYHFAVVSPSTLQVRDANGTFLFDFHAQGTFGLRLVGGALLPIGGDGGSIPRVPATHSAKNVGNTTYHELLFESKVSTNATWPRRPGLLQRAARMLRNAADKLRQREKREL